MQDTESRPEQHSDALSTESRVDQQAANKPRAPLSSQRNNLLIILGVIALVLFVVGIGIKIAPTNTAPATSPNSPTQKLGFENLPTTTFTDTINTDRPIIIVKNNQLVAIDPANTSKDQVIYEIESGLFRSAKWSPDGKKIAYTKQGLPCKPDPDKKLGCAELGIISVGTKTPTIVNPPNNLLTHLDWIDSSTILYSTLKPPTDSYTREIELFRYNIDTNSSSLITTIDSLTYITVPYEIRGNNIYFLGSKLTVHRTFKQQHYQYYLGKFSVDNPSKIDTVLELDTLYRQLSISPDEKYAAGYSYSGVLFVKLDGNMKKILRFQVEACEGRGVVFASDSKHVAVGNHYGYSILDSAGKIITELPNSEMENSLINEINRLSANLPSEAIEYGYITAFSFSPDGKKLFFIYGFNRALVAVNFYLHGFYAFMGEADGKNRKKATITGDGIKRLNDSDYHSEKLFRDEIVGSAW